MKRNELRALGMTPEQIDAVMQMNGNDVNRLKADTVTKSSKEAQQQPRWPPCAGCSRRPASMRAPTRPVFAPCP